MFPKNKQSQRLPESERDELTDLQKILKPGEIGRNFDDIMNMFNGSGVDIMGAFDQAVENSPDRTLVTLDVGCGTGSSIEHFLRVMEDRENLRGKVLNTVGIDRNPLPNRIPEGVLLGKEVRTKFIAADAHKLPIADESIHFGYSVALLRYCNDPLRVLEEGYRVLKPGGIMLWLLGGLTDVSTYPHQDTIFKNTPGGESFNEYFGDDDDHSTLVCIKNPNIQFRGFPYSLRFNFPNLRLRKADKFRSHKVYRKLAP